MKKMTIVKTVTLLSVLSHLQGNVMADCPHPKTEKEKIEIINKLSNNEVINNIEFKIDEGGKKNLKELKTKIEAGDFLLFNYQGGHAINGKWTCSYSGIYLYGKEIPTRPQSGTSSKEHVGHRGGEIY